MTYADIESLEKLTLGQTHNKKWHTIRQHHLTSSNFGTICKATERRDLDTLAKSLISKRDIKVPSVLHGQKYETVAVEKYEKKFGLSTQKCGIFISMEHPQLAASPDRILNDDILVEVKCPYTARDKPISPKTVPYLSSGEGGKLELNKTHDYYYQIQGQLFCANRQLCHLVVFTFKDLVVIEVPRDDEFIMMMIAGLIKFYENHFKKVILDKFLFMYYALHTFTQL